MGVDTEKLAVGMAALYFYKEAEKVLTEAEAAADQKEIQVDQGSVFVNAMGGAVADDGGVQTDETTEANEATQNDMTLLPATPEAEDAYYFGHLTEKFQQIMLKIGTQGDGVWTITWEYWDGDSWEALSGVTDDTNGFTAAVGVHDVKFTMPADWARTTVQSIEAYWIRARVSAYTSVVTAPAGDQCWIVRADKKLVITDFDNYDRGLIIDSIAVGSPAGSDTITVTVNLASTYAVGSTVFPELDLGSVKAVGIEPALTYLQHFNARTGTKVMDKEVVTQKEVRIPFTWEQLNVENMNWFLYGGAVTVGKFSVLTNPQRKGAVLLVFDPSMQDKPYQKIVWLIPSCYIKANGSFSFNDADWMGADGILEVLCEATHKYGKITVSTES